MDVFLPKSTILGSLDLLETYEYYDQPCLFACKNSSGQIFVSVWVDSNEGDIWLYAPISSEKFKILRDGKIDLRSVFTDSEDSFVLKVVTNFDGSIKSMVDVVPCNEIVEDYLPDLGVRMRCLYVDNTNIK